MAFTPDLVGGDGHDIPVGVRPQLAFNAIRDRCSPSNRSAPTTSLSEPGTKAGLLRLEHVITGTVTAPAEPRLHEETRTPQPGNVPIAGYRSVTTAR